MDWDRLEAGDEDEGVGWDPLEAGGEGEDALEAGLLASKTSWVLAGPPTGVCRELMNSG